MGGSPSAFIILIHGTVKGMDNTKQPEEVSPPPGSWASVSFLMASMPQDPNEPPMDWDAWKDEMKEADLE